MKKGSSKVVMCAYGLRVGHLTLETLSALRSADVVFVDALDAESVKPLRPYCRKLVLLSEIVPSYARSDKEGGESARAGARVVIDAVQGGRTAVVMTYGHPAFLCTLTERLAQACAANGVAFEWLDGVSSLSSVLAMAGVRGIPLAGVRLYSACTVEIETLVLDPEAPTLFFDLQILQAKADRARLLRLARLLRAAYPKGHRLLLLRCPCAAHQKGLRKEFLVTDLEAVLRGTDVTAATLYIPHVERARSGVPPPGKVRLPHG